MCPWHWCSYRSSCRAVAWLVEYTPGRIIVRSRVVNWITGPVRRWIIGSRCYRTVIVVIINPAVIVKYTPGRIPVRGVNRLIIVIIRHIGRRVHPVIIIVIKYPAGSAWCTWLGNIIVVIRRRSDPVVIVVIPINPGRIVSPVIVVSQRAAQFCTLRAENAHLVITKAATTRAVAVHYPYRGNRPARYPFHVPYFRATVVTVIIYDPYIIDHGSIVNDGHVAAAGHVILMNAGTAYICAGHK